MTRTPFQVLLFIWLSLVLGCAGIYHTEIFPEDALAQLNKAVTFPQVRDSPSSHQGTFMMGGGEVLLAKRLKDHTRLTVLQLPLRRHSLLLLSHDWALLPLGAYSTPIERTSSA